MAKQSLAAQAKVATEPTTDVATLPPGLAQGTMNVVAPVVQQTPYVSFVSAKGPTFATLLPKLPGLTDSAPVLILPEPAKPILLTPFRFYLIRAFTHFSRFDEEGKITETHPDPVAASKLPYSEEWRECIEAVIIVLHNDTMTPARIRFKTTKTSPAHKAIAALNRAATPEWANDSPEHKASLIVPDARFRFTTTVTIGPYIGKSSGRKSMVAKGTITPTGVSDWQNMAKCFTDPGFRQLCQSIDTAFVNLQRDLTGG